MSSLEPEPIAYLRSKEPELWPYKFMTPIYIQEMFNIKITLYDLRNPCRTVMPKAKTTTHGLKSLTYEGNHIWKSLPVY